MGKVPTDVRRQRVIAGTIVGCVFGSPVVFIVLVILAAVAGGFEALGVLFYLLAPLIMGCLIGVYASRLAPLVAALASVPAYIAVTPLLWFLPSPEEATPILRYPVVGAILLTGMASAAFGGWVGARLKASPDGVRRWSLVGLIGLCLLYTGLRCVVSHYQARAFQRDDLPQLVAQMQREVVRLPPDLPWRAPRLDAQTGTMSVWAGMPSFRRRGAAVSVGQWDALRGRPMVERFLWYTPHEHWREGDVPSVGAAAARLEALGVRPRIVRMVRGEGHQTKDTWGKGVLSGEAVRAGQYPGTLDRPFVEVNDRGAAISIGVWDSGVLYPS